MRRCLTTLEWQARWWENRAQIDTFEGERLEGASAYAHQQAVVCCQIASRFWTIWSLDDIPSLRQYQPGNLELPEGDPDSEMQDMDEDEGDMVREQEDEEVESGERDTDEEELEDEAEEDEEEARIEGEEDGDEDQVLEEEDLEDSNPTLKEMLSQLEENYVSL
ncbi:hypothetical protein VKT23_016615 [Stygiomarasmius scandens]|uniref:Uncharacterized protein n=1 Tax=Marasmiellus scandens TaxID=2682957 RepID=A0ABR1IUB3_9AGAR